MLEYSFAHLAFFLLGITLTFFVVHFNWLPRLRKEMAEKLSALQGHFEKCALLRIKKMSDYLAALYNKKNNADKGTEAYYSLTPSINADDKKVYDQAISFGVNSPEIKNIGLTGPYGSGKSSILKTYRRNHPEHKYLTISLATFKDAKVRGTNKDAPTKPAANTQTELLEELKKEKELLDQVEFSVLQQIFYHVNKEKTPFSRFKRIRTISKKNIFLLTSSIMLLLTALTFLYEPQWLPGTGIMEKYFADSQTALRPAATAILVIGAFLIIYTIINQLKSASLIKLNVNNNVLEISPDKDASILNRHLDEIIYFFSRTHFTIVFIEDLDRFDNPEIFTKLRETNTILNNADSITRKITFIYAIKDDIFKDKNRSKFFDFVIPVIPISNAGNSASNLVKQIRRLNLENQISSELIEDIAIHVQDMRHLLNICNELNLYAQQLDMNTLDYNKLLGLLVYKNSFPEDFALLQYNQGRAYSILQEKEKLKQKLLEETIQQLKQKQDTLDQKIRVAEFSKRSLRQIYIAQLYEEIYKKNHMFNGRIHLNGNSLTIELLLNDQYFNAIRREADISFFNIHGQAAMLHKSFTDIETLVDNTEQYDEKFNRIDSLEIYEREQLKKDIYELTRIQRGIEGMSFKDVLNRNPTACSINKEEEQLLYTLLSNGYLPEDYDYYISYFFEGQISRKDYEFIFSVKNRTHLPYNHPLDKVDQVIKKLSTIQFEQTEALNFDLLSYIINRPHQYGIKRGNLLDQFENITNLTGAFIEEYRITQLEIGPFIKVLAKLSDNFWDWIRNESNYTADQVFSYVKLYLNNADPEDIKKNNSNSAFSHFLSNNTRLLQPTKEQLNKEKMYKALKALDIKFDFYNGVKDGEQEIIDFLVENNAYVIKKQMINTLVSHYCNSDDFDSSHLTKIQTSGIEELIAYINRNITTYLQNIFLQIPNHDQEENEVLIPLLTNQDIDLNIRTQIIVKTSFELDEFPEVDLELWDSLFKFQRIRPTWKNLLDYYNLDEGSTETLDRLNAIFTYINSPEICQKLSHQVVNDSSENEEIIAMIQHLLEEGLISPTSFNLLSSSFDFKLVNFNFDKIDTELSTSLTQTILRFEPQSLENLECMHPTLATEWIEENEGLFIDQYDAFTINGSTRVSLIKRKKNQSALLEKLLRNCSEGEIIDLILEGHFVSSSFIGEKNIKMTATQLLRWASQEDFDKQDYKAIYQNSLAQMNPSEMIEALKPVDNGLAKALESTGRIKENDFRKKTVSRMHSLAKIVSNYSSDGRFLNIERMKNPDASS